MNSRRVRALLFGRFLPKLGGIERCRLLFHQGLNKSIRLIGLFNYNATCAPSLLFSAFALQHD